MPVLFFKFIMGKILIPAFAFLLILISGCKNDHNQSEDGSSLNDSTYIGSLSLKIRDNPTDAGLFAKRSEAYSEAGKIDEAINDIVIALRLDSLHPDYYLRHCELLLLTGNSGDAKESLEKCIRNFPDNIDAKIKLGEIYFYVKDYKNSSEILKEAEKLNPSHPRIFFIRGMIAKETGNVEKAIENFQITIEKDPEFYDVYILLGLLYADKKDSLACDYYKNAIKLLPNSIEAYYNLGMYYQDNDRPAKAIQEYKHIIEKLDSSYIYAYYNMGYIYLVYFQDYDEAIKYFDKVISLDHLYVEAYCNKGVCYEMLGKYKEAYIEFQTACQIHPNFELAIDGLNRIDKKTKTPIQ